MIEGAETTRVGALLLQRDVGTYLGEIGWLGSFATKESVDGNGNPLPWFSYGAIEFLNRRLPSELSVFEYGAGNSTLWWLQRNYRVLTCEHDPEWAAKIRAKAPRAQILERSLSDGTYALELSRHKGRFDVVVIDGRQRVECSKHAPGALRAGGIIIFDNSDRDEYAAAYDFLAQCGFRHVDFWGMGPINLYGWCTSIYYRGENCLGI